METIEQTLNDIETQMADAITKQHLTVARAITSVAGNSLIASKTLDNEFKTVFPELAKLEPDYLNKANPFNPGFVIEIKNGRGSGFTPTWDRIDGILPTRKVMGNYYLDVGQDSVQFIHKKNSMYCVTHKTDIVSQSGCYLHTNHAPSNVTVGCGCSNFYNNIEKHLYGVGVGVKSAQIERGEHRELFDTTTTYKFEVDNYLNLYHPESDLYILFNRTAFPAFPFLARPNIFQSKRHDTQVAGQMKFKLDKTWYSSMDARSTILQAVTELIPDDYSSVYDFYDKFRRMSPYKSALESNTPKPSPDNPASTEDESGDTRDKLIRELEMRLATCLKQIEKTDAYNRELASLYKSQSAELIDLHRRINQINADKQTESTVKRLEESAQVFALKAQLADAQAYIARVQIQGDELTKLEAELSTCKLDVAKYKDLNKGLTDQLLSAKRDLKTKADEHAQGILNINREAVRYSNLEKENARIKAESITQQAKIRELDMRLLTTADTKLNKEPLETVLSTRCEELATERNTLAEKYAQLQREHDTNIKAFDAFKANISRLMTGNK